MSSISAVSPNSSSPPLPSPPSNTSYGTALAPESPVPVVASPPPSGSGSSSGDALSPTPIETNATVDAPAPPVTPATPAYVNSPPPADPVVSPPVASPPPVTPPPSSPPPVVVATPPSNSTPSAPAPVSSYPPPPVVVGTPLPAVPLSPPPPASVPPVSSSPPPPVTIAPSSPPPPASVNASPPESSSSSPPPSKNDPTPPPPPTSTPSPPSVDPPSNSSPPPPTRASPPEPSVVPPVSPPLKETPPPPPSALPPRNSSTPIAFSPPPPPKNSSSEVPPIETPVSPALSGPVSGPNIPPPPKSDGGIKVGVAVGIGIGIGLAVLGLIWFGLWYLKKQKDKKYNGGYVMPSPYGSSPTSESSKIRMNSSAPLVPSGGSGSDYIYSPSESGALGNSRACFAYEELVDITNGFSSHNLLGEGGFGSVYKGRLTDGREVAVKQLKIGGGQGEREFRAEVEIISRVHHRHLVSLVGYCVSDNQRLLVYEYVPNNTLHFHLHDDGQPVMDWGTRIRVAIGAARGIAYLHEDCHPRIIHRDIKASNILIDNDFEAQVSDFGLAKLVDTMTHVTTRVMGTFGYMAPEYASTGKLTEKSDVYSFGVVLLELITGRKPVDTSQPLGDESLVEWARPLLTNALESHKYEGLVDPRLENNYVGVEMFRMIQAAAVCVRHSAVNRPRMSQVVRALDSDSKSADLSNGMKPGQSQIYNSAEQSAEIQMFRRMAFGTQSQQHSTDFYSENYGTKSYPNTHGSV